MLPFLLVNLLFAAVALAVGFAAGAWFLGNRDRQGRNQGQDADKDRLLREQMLAQERAAMASERLRDLAKSMAMDVGEHSQQVGEISAGLQALDVNDLESTGAGVVAALTKIVAANETLQQRLARAEEQIVAQAEEIRAHQTEARTDSLTGLANRRAFDDELNRRYSEWQRKGTPFSLMLLDIDYFKKFNDTHGHQAGDEVLRQVGSVLAETCREMDLPCRYGGEEFAIVMPNTTAVEGKVGAERIRTAIAAMTVRFAGKTHQVTTSVGLAQVSGEEDADHLVKRADEALYQSKAAGRNCGHLHDDAAILPITPGLERAAATDPADSVEPIESEVLDSLSNRTKFAEELRRRVAEAHRAESALAVLVIELAGYGALRRQCGSAAGVLTLESIAQFLKDSLREMDLVARLEEDRFGIMLPGCDALAAMEAGRRAVEAIESCSLPVGDGELDLLIKLGVAEVEPADTVETLVGRAESRLATSLESDLTTAT